MPPGRHAAHHNRDEDRPLPLTVITCEAIVWYGRNDRLRVYLAVCTATALAGIPQTMFHFAEIALTAKIAGLPGR